MLVPQGASVKYKAMVLGGVGDHAGRVKRGLQKIWGIDVPDSCFYEKPDDITVSSSYDGHRQCSLKCLRRSPIMSADKKTVEVDRWELSNALELSWPEAGSKITTSAAEWTGKTKDWQRLLAAPLSRAGAEVDYPDISWAPIYRIQEDILREDLQIDPDALTVDEDVAILGFNAVEFGKVSKLCPSAKYYHLFNFSSEAVQIYGRMIWENSSKATLRRAKIYPVDAADLGRYLPDSSLKLVFARGIFSNDYNSEEKNAAIVQAIKKALKPGGVAILLFSPNVRTFRSPDPQSVLKVLCPIRSFSENTSSRKSLEPASQSAPPRRKMPERRMNILPSRTTLYLRRRRAR
jgi:hypothetical protein